jgi:hypothetical protein
VSRRPARARAVGFVVTLVSCTASPVAPPEPTPAPDCAGRVYGSGYSASLTLAEHNRFPGATSAALGTVEAVLPQRHVRALGYCYWPLLLRVQRRFRGVLGDEVVIRWFGAVESANAGERALPQKPTLRVGSTLVVIGAEPVVAPGDEPVRAWTPNVTYLVERHELVEITGGELALDQFGARVPIDAAFLELERELLGR